MNRENFKHSLPPVIWSSALFRAPVGFSILAFLMFACSTSDNVPVVTSCQLPSDQTATLSGNWTVKPVPIAFHAGDWSSSDMAAITAAADTWNAFYNESQNFSIIDYGGNSASPRTSSLAKPSTPCGSNIVDGTQFSEPVVLYKDASWPYGSATIALTRFCTATATPLNHLNMAYIEVNYQNFFVSGQQVPDLQSILLHEFGHLAGLNHSCESISTTGFPICGNDATYSNAVMAPVFTFDSSGNGQQKRSLTSNDEGRANCLYDGQLGAKTTTTTN
jgi:hypothetical protein